MSEESIRSKTVKSLAWRFAERTGAQGVNFVVSIILARILDTEVYGTIALVTVYMTILQVFVDSGLGNALIIKKDADDLDYSSVFFFNMFVCICLYLVMFFTAPYIAAFYDKPQLVELIRVLGIILIISGLKNVQQAYVTKHLLFRRFFFSTLSGTILAAGVGIYMAVSGYGVWALAAQYLINSTVDTCVLWFTVKWRPKLMFSFERLKGLLTHGWRLLCASLLNTVYDNLRQLVIGKVYTENDLAFYNKGKQYSALIITNINSSIDSVLFPVVSAEQDNLVRVKEITRRAIKTSSYIVWPMLMGMAVCATNLVSILLTDKWLPCVPYLQVFCIYYAFWPIHTANLNAIRAVGRTDIFLRLEIIKKVTDIVILIGTVRFGTLAIAIGALISTVIGALINAYPNRKLINYRYHEQIRDVFPAAALSCAMGLVVYALYFLNLSTWLTLGLQVLLGVAIYVLGSKVLQIESFQYILGMIKNRSFKKRG